MNCINRRQYRCVAKHINVQPSETVLDIGFGNGYMINMLAKGTTAKAAKITGVEISQDMLRVASRKCRRWIRRGKVELALADVCQLPADNASVNKIYTINTFYFWENPVAALREIARILTPNGLFFNVVYTERYLNKIPITRYGFAKYSITEIKDITQSAGLEVVNVIDIQKGKSACIVARKAKTPNR
jgi:ubiquinone/menaquinone biosynthesis C-methylase UbiE